MKALSVLILAALAISHEVLGGVQGFNTAGASLGVFNKIKCAEGLVCTQSSGRLNMVAGGSTMTLENGETIYNSTDDTVGVTSNDEVMTFQVKGFEAKNAILELWADEGDDTADKYSLTSTTANTLLLKNGSTQILGFSSAGVQTLADSETITNASDEVLIGFDDAAANLKLVAFEGTDSSITLQADESDDNGDDWKISATTGNSLSLLNDTSGSFVSKFSINTSGTITFADGETLISASDVLNFGADDSHMTVGFVGFEASDSVLNLTADQGDDNGDTWTLHHYASSNDLIFENNVSGSPATKLAITTGGNITMVGDLTGDGGDQLVGFLQNQIASTTTTLTATQCGSTIINDSADVVSLPEASTVLGCQFTFIVGNVSNFDVNPDNGDQIVLLTDAAGDAIRADAIGESVVLQAISASAWAPVGAEKGTWTDVN